MPVIELTIPTLGESISNVTVAKWLKNDGDIVELDEPICEIETEKANQELVAEYAGKLTFVAQEGDDIDVGAVYGKIDTDAAEASTPATAENLAPKLESPIPTQPTEVSSSNAAGHPSPAAAKIMAEGGVTASNISGTGVGGRITKSDAESAVQNKAAAPAAPTPPPTAKSSAPAPTPTPVQAFSRNERREKMSRMRRTIARRLVSAKNNTAMLTTFNEVDMKPIMDLRKEHQDAFVAKHGIKLGFMSIFAKACAQVLMEMPQVNAFIDGDDLIYHDYADISLAISTPNGLVVPPIKNVESISFADFEKELKALAVKARDGKLTLDEMSGGTFTITNGGVFGSMMSTPIINEPQSAILGMHNIVERAVVVNGEIVIRPMMYLALSYDHRVIDGSSSVTFLVKVKELIENPVRLFMGI